MARDGTKTAGSLLRKGPDPLEEERRRRVAADTAKDDAPEERAAAETVRAVHAACDLARSEEAGDGLARLVDDARLGVDLEAAHGVVQDGSHDGDVEVVIELPLARSEELYHEK